MQANSNLSTTVTSFQQSSALHMTHLQSAVPNKNPYEKFSIQFQLPSAMIWQIKFILSSVNSKKAVITASVELGALSEQFGRDFDKYLLLELFDQIELKDASKAQKDKSESVKVILLNQELTRASAKPEFLTIFGEIINSIYGQDSISKSQEIIQEITKRLKLNTQNQILITLSMLESTSNMLTYADILKILKLKLVDFHINGKPDQLPEYAVYQCLHLFDTEPELSNDEELREPKQFLIDAHQNRFSQFIPLRCLLNQDISTINSHYDLPSYCLFTEGGGLEDLEFVSKILKPWEVLIDLGPHSTHSYDYLLKTLQEFKQVDEQTMAVMLVQLAVNNESKEDHISKILINTFESNKDGCPDKIKKEPDDKKGALLTWSLENLHKVFKELYPSLNWNKVFENFGKIEDDDLPESLLEKGFEQRQFLMLFQMMNKCKLQNANFNLSSVLELKWSSTRFQFAFIQQCVGVQYLKKDFLKCILFTKLQNKVTTIPEIIGSVDSKVTKEDLEIWQSVDLVERLIILSDSTCLFKKIRRIFDYPIQHIPDYLLLSLSLCKPNCGNLMLDEILSILMPIFLGNHDNSAVVLSHLFDNNQALFIRGICELCKHDQRLMNLSRVLDITQEIKASLIKIVYCQDYNFAVNLGILAGKRDFLHYDVWIKSRIKDVGSPFINALIKYINENIIIPVNNFIMQNQQMIETNPEGFEQQKNSILERSHISKEKLIQTIDHLQNNQLRQNDKVSRETHNKIQELVMKNQELFPQHYEPGQNSEEIEAAANEHFQRVFSAEESQVDLRIDELIRTMQNFKESQIVKEQEIYACMLHGLFDEYRFLHRYPPQYLTKIAKLFGAIIKNNLLDRVLQDIALKFVYEAFRRDNRRQKFGIIVIKSFFNMLPRFPKFLEDIYNIRQIIQNSEPQMMQEIEQMYNQMIHNADQNVQGDSATQSNSDQKSQSEPNANINIEAIQENMVVDDKKMNEDIAPSKVGLVLDSKKDDKKDKKNQQKTGKEQQVISNQANNKQAPKYNKNQPNQPAQLQNPVGSSTQLRTMTPPLGTREFIPTNRAPNQVQGLNNFNKGVKPENAQNKLFVPNQKTGDGVGVVEQSSIVDHVNVSQMTLSNSMGKFISQPVVQQPSKVSTLQNPTGGSLNVRSAEFQRPQSNPAIPLSENQKQININSKEFMPSKQQESIQAKKQVNPVQIAQLLTYRQQMRDKIQKAIDDGSKIRFEDLLEDDTIHLDNEYVEDQIRIICNNTGKSNFKQKIEDLKKFVVQKAPQLDKDGKEIIDKKSVNAKDNLRWFINYILTKRLGHQSVSLQGIYIEMIREVHQAMSVLNSPHNQNVINQTLFQVCVIFKKCMLIDEADLEKVINAHQQASMVIKNYVASLGSFVGTLTLAKNEPLRQNQIDLKQILVEGSQVKNKKLAIVFVCRVLKETIGSRVFNIRNPWLVTMLQILREVSQIQSVLQKNNLAPNEHNMEIESLFKALNIQNIFEIKPHGILESMHKPSNLILPHIRKELEYIFKKTKVIMPVSLIDDNDKKSEESNDARSPSANSTVNQSGSNDHNLLRQQINIIQQRVTVSNEVIIFFQQFKSFSERRLRKVVGSAVDNSIVEILPPVVDRSVTIALITTRELVLKDFAYDGDHSKVVRASDLIIQNLAGSLALVTCREPLRMSLNTNLKKIFEEYIIDELKIEIVKSTFPGIANQEFDQNSNFNQQFNREFQQQEHETTQQSQFRGSVSNSGANANEASSQNKVQPTSVSEEKLNEIANLASRENLELGCMLIKQKVIEKALKKVREDIQITQAIDNRQRFQELGIKHFRDDNISQQFNDLPVQLQPNKDGLTQSQFQVYEDFQMLNQYIGADSTGEVPIISETTHTNTSNSPDNTTRSINLQSQQANLPSILKIIDQQGLTEMNEDMLMQKLEQMNENQENEQDTEMLWTYTKRNFENACKSFDSRNQQVVQNQIDILSFIVKNYLFEDFSIKLLNKVLFILDVRIFNNLELNILLMRKGIISIAEWDRQIAKFFKKDAAGLPESELQFFANILEISIVEEKIFTKEQVPQLISVIQSMKNDRKIGKFCQYILNCLSIEKGAKHPDQELNNDNSIALKNIFLKWVVISYINNKEEQEKQINTLFIELREMGIDSDQQLLFSLSKIMIKVSIERALYFQDGERRPNDRLDLRYIDSFVKLIVVLLTMLSFNKHEFMTKVFEYISTLMDEDHKKNKNNFNQRPYYRILMNILTTVNHQYCFNQKNQQLILYSLAELFVRLTPVKYPGFAFAWLELISHKQFMPHFLKQTSAPTQQDQQANKTNIDTEHIQMQLSKRFKIKEIIVQLLAFLKQNMIQGQQMPTAFQAFYHATMRIFNVIVMDYPEFLSEFHFNFVNNLPDHCIQLRNLILFAHPKNIQQPDPFLKHLKIDKLNEIKQNPKILSNYENFLTFMNLKDDLDNLKRTRNLQYISEICFKMEQSEVIINGKRYINQNVISSVVLYIAQQACQNEAGMEHRDTFKQIVHQLNDSTRQCFLNAIVNELRFPNNHTFYFSCIILFIYSEANKEIIQEQITTIFLERLQTCGPYPWGLMISFRELIQNPKYKFLQKQFILQHTQAINNLFKTRLRNFLEIVPHVVNQIC